MRIYDTLTKKEIHSSSMDPEVVKEIQISDRKERYQEERKVRENEVSLDAMDYEPEYLFCIKYAQHSPVEDEAMRRWTIRYLRLLLARLPPGEKAVVKELFFEGLSVNAAAKKLGCRPETIRERRRRGLLRLGTYLKEAGINSSKIGG